MATKTDLEIRRGDTQIFPIEASDEAGLVDLTGWKMQFMVKKNISDGDANAIIDLELTAFPLGLGLAEFRLEAATTAALPIGKFYYDYQVIDPDGVVGSTDVGFLTVKPDVNQGTT